MPDATPDGLYIGLMSGTSADAIDAALVSVNASTVTFCHGITHHYPEAVRDDILKLTIQPQTTLGELCTLEQRISRSFADATRKLLDSARIESKNVQAIGSHGQTVVHQPLAKPPYTLQLSDPSLIAHHTGIDTVADFRRADIAAGGQGAPLVPAFHATVFGTDTSRVVLNLGGIANVTIIGNSNPGGFDTGPANTLLDAWCREKLAEPFDKDGARARGGVIDQALLHTLLQDDYFAKPPPKSTGPDYFNLGWMRSHRNDIDNLSADDVLATLTELTAISATNAIRSMCPPDIPILVCGGGVRNAFMIERIAANTGGSVTRTDEHGVDCDYCEAMAFAWLAFRRKQLLPGNQPVVTGAASAKVLGGYFPAS